MRALETGQGSALGLVEGRIYSTNGCTLHLSGVPVVCRENSAIEYQNKSVRPCLSSEGDGPQRRVELPSVDLIKYGIGSREERMRLVCCMNRTQCRED
jgi:hypothetical protein